MKTTKVELYDKYYSTYPNLYKGDTEMPNHCYNRVTFYSDNTEEVAKLKKIFEGENIFPQIIPEPDWPNVPLAEKDVKRYISSEPRGKVGELPIKTEEPFMRYQFSSSKIFVSLATSSVLSE